MAQAEIGGVHRQRSAVGRDVECGEAGAEGFSDDERAAIRRDDATVREAEFVGNDSRVAVRLHQDQARWRRLRFAVQIESEVAEEGAESEDDGESDSTAEPENNEDENDEDKGD